MRKLIEEFGRTKWALLNIIGGITYVVTDMIENHFDMFAIVLGHFKETYSESEKVNYLPYVLLSVKRHS